MGTVLYMPPRPAPTVWATVEVDGAVVLEVPVSDVYALHPGSYLSTGSSRVTLTYVREGVVVGIDDLNVGRGQRFMSHTFVAPGKGRKRVQEQKYHGPAQRGKHWLK